MLLQIMGFEESMTPKIYEQTTNAGNNRAEKIISCISKFDCSPFFGSHLGKPQKEQRKIVSDFQQSIRDKLAKKIPGINWKLEYSPSTEKKDTIDIYGKNAESNVIIELDKHRADQIAKKFVSRSALFIDQHVFYISLCYPGTKKMNLGECIKYFGYCKQLSQRMGSEYAGFIIE